MDKQNLQSSQTTNPHSCCSTLTGPSKYVPPHLRDRGGSGGGSSLSREPNNNRSRGGGRGRYGGGRGEDRSPLPPPQPANSRWGNVDLDGDAGSSGGVAGAGGGAGASGSRGGAGASGSRREQRSIYGGPQINELGFHGDMKPDKRTEQRLFGGDVERQTTGINFDNYDNIPVETSGSDCPEAITEYTIETIGEALYRNTQLCGYSRPTPVQKYSIPIGIAGRDLMACTQTGSGKTAGFLFPIIMAMLQRGGSEETPSSRRRVYPEALVLAPNRELAVQIQEEAKRLTYCSGIASVVVYGGADIQDQIHLIDLGCDLLVATPVRLVDLIKRDRVAMDNCHFLVLDEVDRMLDLGCEPQLRRIVKKEGMPMGEDRQTMMFSATFPPNIQRLAADFMHDYIFLTVGHVGSASEDVTQNVEYAEEVD